MPDEKYLPIPLHSLDDESDFLLSINPRNKRSRTQPFVVFLLASAAAVVYTVLVVAATINRLELDPLCRGGPRVLPNVLHDAIEYIPKVWHDGHGDPDHDPWFGRPTPELSRTWMDLLEWSSIRVPEEEMHRLGREAEGVHFPDGGYFGMLTVYHNLHCLMRIHHHSYLDYYFPDMTDEEKRLEARHMVHCLHMIKQSLMCSADTTILTMRWLDYAIVPTINKTSPHTCVDWSPVEDWARANWVDTRAEGVMIHPTMGRVFTPDRKNNASRIGVVVGPGGW